MGFPSYAGVRQQDLASAWANARSVASAIKEHATNLRNASAAGPVTAASILEFSNVLADYKGQLANLAAIPGLGDYAKAQISDPTLDIAAAYAAMATQIDVTISWIAANIPKDGSGYLLVSTLVNGKTVSRTFTSAQTAGMRTALDALIATID